MSLMDKLMQPMIGGALPVPADYAANELVGNLFTVWAGGFGIAVIPWALYCFFKKGNDIPLLMIFGGLICSLIEPMLDHLGHLWYPTNLPGPAFVGYDLNVPYLIPPCYVFFISMTGYWAYTRMKAGLTVKGVFITWFLIAMTDVIMEMPGTATQAYIYYGDASFKVFGFPLAWGWLNGTSMLLVGFLLYLVEPYLRGWNRLFIIPVSVVAMGASYGMTAWPYFMSLNHDMPWIATRLLTLLSLALCLMIVRFTAAIVASGHEAKNPIEKLNGNPVPA
ncbi:MAG: hypothetical protein KKF24_02415 [Gammaproteobacteria bacterium]|jgi:hypothetical protein|nr:hypothetical protein [Gammaproteobacteria bacterium]MBU1831527.1 hypothetical protein [Gammaproteobacteria bacterium]